MNGESRNSRAAGASDVGELRRSLGLGSLTFYGVGVILGAGIYSILGEAAGIAGEALWWSFLLASLAALLTGMSYAELATMFRAGLEGILQRGKAQVGDKTMIDALQPAVEALEDAAQQGLALHTALEAARFSAEKGMHNTIEMQANRGRASYLGPRAIVHQDPGATSLYYLIETAAQTLVTPVDTKNVQPAAPSGKMPRAK